jgi:two-component system LytT family sensor kinase
MDSGTGARAAGANDAADDAAPRVSWTAAFLLFTALGVLRLTYLFLDDVTRSASGTFVRRLFEESTGTYGAFLLCPLLVAVERRWPLDLGRWRRNWLAHVAAYVPFSIAHTSLLAASRAVIFPFFGRGVYDYGRMPVRYFMEAPQDLIGYCTIVALLTFLRMQQRLRARDVRTAALERDAANARLEALSLRLQPHFLFNALNTISSTVYGDPVAADEMIGRLGDLLRHALRTGDRQEITVGEELETLNAYLTFVEARFGDRLRCTIDVDSDTRQLAIPAFLLQPLAENAVRHGASLEYGSTSIIIHIWCNDGRLLIDVENAVDGPAGEPARTGTGLGTTRDRLRLLYGDAATLTTDAGDGRFRVTVDLPARAIAALPPMHDAVHANADR